MSGLDRTPHGRAAARVCADWGLTEAEAAALVRGDAQRAHMVIGIGAILTDLYSPPLPAMWMTTPNRNPAVGGTESSPVRPVDHATHTEGGLEDVWRLLRGYMEGE